MEFQQLLLYGPVKLFYSSSDVEPATKVDGKVMINERKYVNDGHQCGAEIHDWRTISWIIAHAESLATRHSSNSVEVCRFLENWNSLKSRLASASAKERKLFTTKKKIFAIFFSFPKKLFIFSVQPWNLGNDKVSPRVFEMQSNRDRKKGWRVSSSSFSYIDVAIEKRLKICEKEIHQIQWIFIPLCKKI